MIVRKLAWGFALTGCVILGARPARAAGFDTPILYSARHQGMGGTAISYVDDPSAAFHNPAGLRGVQGLSLLGDFTLLIGTVQASPDPAAIDVESNTTLAPFFLFGAAYRAHEWVSVGVGVFPVASGGAEFEYDLAGNRIVDEATIMFFEATPLVSLNLPEDALLPGELSFGAGYRASLLQFERKKGDPNDPQVLDLEMSGTDFAGFRVGAQYEPIPGLGFGVVFRNKVEITTTADSATVFTQTATDAELPFVLPAKLGLGAHFAILRFRFAVDGEYAFQSQNDRVELSGTLNGMPSSVPNVFDWDDGLTLRFGGEYRLGGRDSGVPLRAGYIFDSAVTSETYPGAFSTPPAPTHTFTAGTGYDAGNWEINAAAAYRFGQEDVEAGELGAGCPLCSYAGEYSLDMTALFLDASVDFDL